MAKTNAWMMPAAGVGATVLVVAIGAVLYLARPLPDQAPETGAQSVASPAVSDTGEAPADGAASKVVAVPEPSETADREATDASASEPAPETATAAAEGETAPELVLPEFDVVRIPAEGFATVAGRAAPGAVVAILVDGEEVAITATNGRGEFVALLELTSSNVPREMRLSSRSGDTILESAESIIIAPAAVVPAEQDAEGEDTGPADGDLVVADAADLDTAAPTVPVDPMPNNAAKDTPPDATSGAGDAVDMSTEVQSGTARNMADAVADQVLSAAEEAVQSSEPSADIEPTEDAASEAEAVTETQPETVSQDPPAAESAAPEGTDSATDSAEVAIAETSGTGAEETGSVAADQEARVAEAEASDADTADATPQTSTAVAPTVLMADDEGVKVLQQSGTTPTDLRIDAVTYDPEGRVYASGRAAAGADLRLYLDQAFLTEAVAGEDGQWRQELVDVAAGRYRLRVDQVDAEGKVLSRAEIPFQRESLDVLAELAAADAATAEAAETAKASAATEAERESDTEAETQPASSRPRLASVTVQPGNTLWGIATKRYGSGFLYVRVFDANRDQIRDPDLIYPGQIFALPE